jgi:hypothetical protein
VFTPATVTVTVTVTITGLISCVSQLYLIGPQKWAAKAVEMPLFFPPKVPQSMFAGADLTAAKLGLKNFRKTCCEPCEDGDGDFCTFLGTRFGNNQLGKKGIQN